jgi:plasmid replication initiation protein
MDKEKEIISQANEITSSMSPLDLVQKRCFYLIVQQVRKDYVETDREVVKYEDMTIHMTPENLSRARDEKHVNDAFKSLERLRSAYFTIENDNFKLVVGIINYAKYDKQKKIYEIQVSKEILPYLVDLSKRYFTSYNLCVAISLRHVSTQRFYELCNQYKHKAGMKFFLEADELRKMLMLDDKYQKDAHLRKFVFDVAQKELKDLYDKGQSDLCFDYKPDEATKVGKKYTRYWIYIHTKETDKFQEQTFKQTQQQALYVYKVCLSVLKRDKKYCQRVYNWLELHPDKIQEMFDKVTRWQKDYKGADLAKIIRFSLKEDFKII